MADYRKLEIKVCSAQNLKNVRFLSKMDPYVVVSISCDPSATHKTPVDRIGNKNPTWNSTIKFAVDVVAAQTVQPMLLFSILCERALGDKPIGEVRVPLMDLLGSVEDGKLCHVAYQVRKPSGRVKGELNFSYQWSEKISGGYQYQYPPTAGYGNVGYPPHQYNGYPPLPGPSYGMRGQTGNAAPKKNGVLGIGVGVGAGVGLPVVLLVGDLLFN